MSDTCASPASRAQAIASQISHSLNPFGVSRRRGIDESESAEALRATAKCRKPAARRRACDADDEHCVVVSEPEERVERHHEAALRLGAAPGARDLLELGAQAAVDGRRPSTRAV